MECLKMIFDLTAGVASIVGLALTWLVYHKVRRTISAHENVKKMIDATTIDNKYYAVKLNMDIDVSSPPSQKIKELMNFFDLYNDGVEKIKSYAKEKIKNENYNYDEDGKGKGIYNVREYVFGGATINHKNKIKLLLMMLEIQVMELEIANKNVPMTNDFVLLTNKCEEFERFAKKIGYID